MDWVERAYVWGLGLVCVALFVLMGYAIWEEANAPPCIETRKEWSGYFMYVGSPPSQTMIWIPMQMDVCVKRAPK